MITLQKINSLAGTKIFSMSKAERISMMNSFPAMMKMIGIPAITDGKEAALVLQTVELLLTDSFADLSAEEIRYAFLQYSSGELLIDDKDRHYGLWNLKFIGAVLSAFRIVKQELVSAKPQAEYIAQKFQLNGKSDLEQWKEDYIFMLTWIKADGKIPPAGNFHTCYHYLKASGRIELSKVAYHEHIASVRRLINEDADLLEREHQRNSHRKMFAPDTVAFKNKCREEYFKYWISEKILENTDENGLFTAWIDQEIKNAQQLLQHA